MKIIDIAMCVNNVDPAGIGRIRAVRYNDYIGEKEKSVDYEEWSDKDPFLCMPFLPANINFIPEAGQSVKLINYNSEKETVNQEYIAGPFGTMYDFNSQTFSQQLDQTTYGVAVKHKPNIRNTSGQYINKKSENTFAKETDYGVYGKYGSDIIFTENGLQLRGGKLLSKDAASVVNRATMLSTPLMARKSAKIYLKKFPKKMTLEIKKTETVILDVKDLKSIIEYEVDNLTTPTKIYIKLYSVTKSLGQTVKTNYFTENSPLPTEMVKLINIQNDNVSPTITLDITSVPINDVYKEIRDAIYDLHDKGLKYFNSLYEDLTIHPFYFRPSSDFKTLPAISGTQKTNKQTILNGVKVLRVGPGSGLIWSQLSAKPSSTKKTLNQEYIKIDKNSDEQSFGSIVTDKLYLLSTDTNETDKKIEFNSLDQYEYNQEDYIKRIDPNTFATVRGENLISVLRGMVNVIFSHAHNVNKPIAGQPDYSDGKILLKQMETLENDILNKSIRIN